MDAREERIEEILGQDCEKNMPTALRYKKYLATSIKLPCLLTGVEDFLWEERYILGEGSKKEYQKLKKDNPSYTDKYKLIELLEPEDEECEIIAKVKRIADEKIFKIGLSWLEAATKSDSNYQLLNDYSVWHINY